MGIVEDTRSICMMYKQPHDPHPDAMILGVVLLFVLLSTIILLGNRPRKEEKGRFA